MSESKVVVIGVDGATFNIINLLIEKGTLPNIEKLIKNGAHGVLQSTIPPVSPVAWTSFMTGKKPEKHGIFDFVGKIEGSNKFKFNNAKDRKSKPLWMYLSEKGKRVFVSGVTLTYPPDPVNGYMVSGLGAPPDADLSSYAYPTEFAEEFAAKFSKYKSVPEADLRKLSRSDKEKDKYIKAICEQMDYRVDMFRHMWNKEHFDFSMVFFLDTDGISHYFWKYMDSKHKSFQAGNYGDSIFKVYEKVDESIGELLKITGDDVDVVMISDHGFGPLNRVVFLNNWLEKEGYLKFKSTPLTKKAVAKARALLGRGSEFGSKEVDWSRSKVFTSGTVGNIFINLKGREAEGIVDMAEYEELCVEVKEKLLQLKDPESGVNIADKVYSREELYKRTDIPTSPDLVVTFERGYDSVGDEIGLHSITDTGEVVADSHNWSGTHEPEGIFIAHGHNIKKGCCVKDANIIDVAPSLLYLCGSSVPENMDGKVLTEVFDDEFVKSVPLVIDKDDDSDDGPSEELTDEENEQMMDQLRNLGYIN